MIVHTRFRNKIKWFGLRNESLDNEANRHKTPVARGDFSNVIFSSLLVDKHIRILHMSSTSANSATSTQTNTSASKGTSDNFVSVETQARLQAMEAKITKKKETTGNYKFIKMRDGEHQRFRIIPDLTSEKDITYEEGQPPSHRFLFYVKPIVNGKVSEEIFEWTIVPQHAALVLHQLNRGFVTIDVERKGESKNNTRYFIDAVL